MLTVFGSINIDLVCRVEHLPRPGETVAGENYQLIPGGKGANQALAAQRALAAGAAPVRMIGAVGRDDFAGLALALLDKAGVDLTLVNRVEGTTGLAAITVDSHAENVIVLSPGANRTVRAAQADAVGFGPDDTLLLQMEVDAGESLTLAARAKAGGARVILSLAPFRPLDPATFAAVGMVIVNETEAADLAAHIRRDRPSAGGPAKPPVDPEAAIEAMVRELAAELATTVVVTRGAEGVIAAEAGGRVLRAAAYPVKPVDTTGAGDTFAGVLAATLAAGGDLAHAMKRAAVAGSLACLTFGAQTSFPEAAAIDQVLATL